ncbi:glycosyltransferase family 2 protein [Thauera sp. WH-1]|uniref:glycosyltransferase family 2 protein n=1 Tax=Thauera sp. WH-1 TaxID=3398230 RepID=UPI0039FBA99D
MRLDLSIVIPVFRSAATLPTLYKRLIDSLEPTQLSFEIIVVEDCGGDNSWEVISRIAQMDNRVFGIQLSRNFGQHAATICGFAQSRGEWIATLDDDLEQPPEKIPELVQKAQSGFDLIYGVYPQRTHKPWRNITSSIARWLFKKAIPSLNDTYTSFRVIRGDIARELQRFDSPFPFVDGYLSWLTNRCTTVEVPHESRLHGQSNYTIRKLITHTINIFVTFSDAPLRIASWAGILASAMGITWLLVIVMRYLLGGISVSGFASIMAAILFFGGIQLLVLGIFGEYLGRMNFKTSKKPLYLIGRRT